MIVFAILIGEKEVTCRMRHLGNERQQCVNNFLPCESDNQKMTWSL